MSVYKTYSAKHQLTDMIIKYKLSGELKELFEMIPEDSGWNYLKLVMEPRQSSTSNIDAVVRIRRGVPSVEFGNTPRDYINLQDVLLLESEYSEQKWEKIEIEENEPHWVSEARLFLPAMLDEYKITELEQMLGAYHRGFDSKPSGFDLKISGFDGVNGKDEKGLEVYAAVLESELKKELRKNKLLAGLLNSFNRKFEKV
jgi:hypothetical protein